MPQPAATSPVRIVDVAIAAAIVVIAIAISPIGIRLATGRLDLSPRVIVLSLTFGALLLVLAAAVASSGRVRTAFFYLLMLSLPIVLLAAVEAAAIASHLADRIAPIEDMSTLVHKNNWPAHFMSTGRKVEKDGLQLYSPWHSEDIVINDLGLRTAPPSPKAPGEWRIAVTGGSVAFGWRMRDADTIAVQMQELLRGRGLVHATIYNFGIDSVVIADELALLRRFQKIYDIDQVVFLTGANDVTTTYMGAVVPAGGAAGLISGVNEFELLKVAGRLKASLLEPSPTWLAKFDQGLLPRLAQHNSLRDGLIAADDYCRGSGLRCDFVLQPVLLTRKVPVGPEVKLARALRQVYPRYDQSFAVMYRTAVSAGLGVVGLGVEDASDVFDASAEPYFIDVAHLNEAGNRRLAEHVAEVAARGIPNFAVAPAARGH